MAGGEVDDGKVRGCKYAHLQLFHLAGPAAALLTVDATDGQRQDLLLQLWVRVDLKKKSRMRSVLQLIEVCHDESTECVFVTGLSLVVSIHGKFTINP